METIIGKGRKAQRKWERQLVATKEATMYRGHTLHAVTYITCSNGCLMLTPYGHDTS